MSDNVYVGRRAASIRTAPAFAAFTGVEIAAGVDSQGVTRVYTAGTNTGRVLQLECPWATQEMAAAILTQIQGWAYQPYEAAGAHLEPAAELGDGVTVNGLSSVLASQTLTLSEAMVSDIAAPADEEIDHEYPYEDAAGRKITRRIAGVRASLQVSVDAITATVEQLAGEVASLEGGVHITATGQMFIKEAGAAAYTPASLTLTATSGLAAYQWYVSQGGGAYTAISGATGSSLTVLPSDISGSSATFRCNATNSGGTSFVDYLSIAKLADGESGQSGSDGYTLLLSNEYIEVPVNEERKPTASATYSCVVTLLKGLTALTPTTGTPGEGEFSVTPGAAPTGFAVSQSPAGTILLLAAASTAIGDTGDLTLTITPYGADPITAHIHTSANMNTVAVSAKTVAEQTAEKFTWIVASGTDETNFTLTSHMASLVAAEIDLTGYVTITDLGSTGTVTIDGGRIAAGTLVLGALAQSLQNSITNGETAYNRATACRGTCSTAAATAAKVVEAEDFVLATGAAVTVYNSTAQTVAGAITLNVNGTGAKTVYVNGAATAAANQLLWAAGSSCTFVYDGTYWRLADNPGIWYGSTCTTAAGTAAKTTSVTGAVIFKGAVVRVPMQYANTSASATLNVTSLGGKAIYYGTGTTRPTTANAHGWVAGATVLLSFDGQYWRLQENSTYIDADCIVTGSLSADIISGGTINAGYIGLQGTLECMNDSGTAIGYLCQVDAETATIGSSTTGDFTLGGSVLGLSIPSSGSYTCGVGVASVPGTTDGSGFAALWTPYAAIQCLSLASDGGGQIDIAATYGIRIIADYLTFNNTTKWSSSDRRVKHDIDYDLSAYVRAFDALRPCTFVFNDSKDGKTSMGLIAQETEEALAAAGVDVEAINLIGASPRTGRYYLDYEQLIPILIAKVQEQDKRIKELEASA